MQQKYVYTGTSKKGEQGFTLMELLTVIAIIGILATVVLSGIGSARERARNTSATASLQAAQLEAERFFDQRGRLYFVANNNNVCTSVNALTQKACQEAGCANCAAACFRCGSQANSYAIALRLRGTNGWYCVDSARFQGNLAAVPGIGGGAVPFKCP